MVLKFLITPLLRRLSFNATLPTVFCICKFSNRSTSRSIYFFISNLRSLSICQNTLPKQHRTDIEPKSRLISLLNLKTCEDALPFYKIPYNTLLRVYRATKRDETNGFCKNRLYYISDRIKCSPSTLSQRLAKRTFIYDLSFDWLHSSLNVLLEMGVTGDRILRDLWVLKYHPSTIRERLQRVKDMGVDNLYPWMVRCTEDILNRFVTISQDTKNILGDNKSTQIYLANRLSISPEAVEDMCLRIPALKTIRVTKVKHFLDFLEEEGFSARDIAAKPRVLSASQKTVKQRLEKLRKLGRNEINLNVLCRSRKDFNKYCESIISATNQRE